MTAPKQTSPNLTKLDSGALESFIEYGLDPFLDALAEIRGHAVTQAKSKTKEKTKDPDQLPSLFDLSQPDAVPLKIGNMANDAHSGGQTVIANIKTAASSIDAVFENHIKSFTQLKLELKNVIATMGHAQSNSLITIDGQKFLTAIQDYDNDISGSIGSGSASGSGTGSGGQASMS